MLYQAKHIFHFLPLKYASPIEGEYVNFWWETYTENIDHQNFHVAFLAFHTLYMTAVYFMLYKISKLYRSSYEHSLFHLANDDETHYFGINSAFSFSKMKEKSVFRFLKIAGADHALVGEVSRFIDDRNNAAHAKGAIFFKDDASALEKRINEYLVALEKIQNLFITESTKIRHSWKISQMDEAAMRLYLESEILINSLNLVEVNMIATNEKAKRQQISKLLIDLVADTV